MNRGLTQVIADLLARAAAPAARQAAQPHPHPGQGPLAAVATWLTWSAALTPCGTTRRNNTRRN